MSGREVRKRKAKTPALGAATMSGREVRKRKAKTPALGVDQRAKAVKIPQDTPVAASVAQDTGLCTAATALSTDVDVEADLRAALAQEQLDWNTMDVDTFSTLKLLWADRACRTKLRGELASFTRAKIDWAALLDKYATAENKKENGKEAVQDYVKTEANLTPGAASAVSRFVYHQIQVSRVTPFMRALSEFPRHIFHGAQLSPDLTPWMPTDLAKTIHDLQVDYANGKVAHPEEALFKALEAKWGDDAFRAVMGKVVKRPVWWSAARRRELGRLLAVARLMRDKRSAAVDRPSRIWLSGPKQGKTHFMRDCALTLALLHPEALVGYCQYNQCQLTPQQVWQLQGPHVPQGDMSFDAFSLELYDRLGRTPFFFSDELEFLYEQRIRDPLYQLQELGESTVAVSVVTGTVAQLPHMISSSHRQPEFVGLPELNHNKHTALHLPPILSWAEAQDLARTVAPVRWSDKVLKSKQGERALKDLCWRFAGSLGAMVAHLQGSDTAAYSTPPLKGDPFEPSNIMIGLVSRASQVSGVPLGDAFALPRFTREQAVRELSLFDVQHPDRAVLKLKDECVIVEVQPSEFRLVHPVHVEWYRTQLMASGCTVGHVQEFRRVGTRGTLAEELIIRQLAKKQRVDVLPVSWKELSAALQRLATGAPKTAADTKLGGHHMFTSVGMQGHNGLELVVEGGRVKPEVNQYQVKVYPSGAYLDLKDVVDKAAAGLAKVMRAASAELTDVTLHVWYYGKPVKLSTADQLVLGQRYRDMYREALPKAPSQVPAAKVVKAKGRAARDGLPRVLVELYQTQDVLDLLPPALSAEIQKLPEPWTAKKTA